jgi:dTDP-4-amino-4,6-dideoxygalactose transaminase
MLANLGSRKPGLHDEMGFDSRLDTVQAAVLEVKLKYLVWWNGLRRVHANAYNNLLARRAGIALPAAVEPESQHAWHRYVIRVSQREKAIESLGCNGVAAAAPYPLPLHKLRVYGNLVPGNRALRESEAWAQESLSLPIYPELTQSQRSQVVEHLRPARSAAAA